MITIKLRELAMRTKTERWPDGVDTSYKLREQCPSAETGRPMSKSIISQLWHGEMKRIGLTTIEAICVGLNCTPSDWIIVDPVTPKPAILKKRSRAKRVPQS